MDYKQILSQIISSEKKAGELLLHAHSVIAEEKTDSRNVVTEYDRRVQEMLMSDLSGLLPQSHFFSEEMDEQDSIDAEHVFVIDPIDGTMNFVRGFQHSAICVAYMNNGELCAAAVYDPFLREMFSASKGEGAWLNGKRICAGNASLAQSVVTFGTSPYYDDTRDGTFAVARAAFDASLDIRRAGCAEIDLCSVAAGRSGLFFEMMLSFWDFAAGTLIASEAGAVCSDITGKPLPLDGSKSSVLCGTKQAVEDFLRLKF